MVRADVQPHRRPRRRARWRPASASGCAAAASCPEAREPVDDGDPGDRRRHDAACAPRSSTSDLPIDGDGRPAVPAVHAVPRARRVRRRRARRLVLDAARRGDAAVGEPIDAVGITNQRASTVVWDRSTGRADRARRSAGRTCAPSASASWPRPSTAWRWRPNQSATKVAWLLDQRRRRRATATSASAPSTRWLAWALSGGELHVTDHTNAAVTGLLRRRRRRRGTTRVARRCSASRRRCCRASSTRSGVIGEATALPGAPPIAALVGDQQASLVGQGCVDAGPGEDHVRHRRHARRVPRAPTARRRPGAASTARSRSSPGRAAATLTWGAEAIMLSAARTSSGCATTSASSPRAPTSHDVAASVDDTDGVVYVPALLGLGTPRWDYGARGTLARRDPGDDAGPRRAGRAGGRRPARRRSRRGRRGRHGPADRRRCASTAG